MKMGIGPIYIYIYELALLLIGIGPADGLAPLSPKPSVKPIVEL